MQTKPITIRHLGPDDADILMRAREGTFDNPVDPSLAFRFLAVGLNEMVVALAEGEVVGFASGTALMHPDKPTAFFINEIGVHEDFQRQGIATRLLDRILDIARSRGCEGIWLATEPDNIEALGLYRKSAEIEEAVIAFGWDDAL